MHVNNVVDRHVACYVTQHHSDPTPSTFLPLMLLLLLLLLLMMMITVSIVFVSGRVVKVVVD